MSFLGFNFPSFLVCELEQDSNQGTFSIIIFPIPDSYWSILISKFVFSKKATKFDKIFNVDLTLKISSIFVAFLENFYSALLLGHFATLMYSL